MKSVFQSSDPILSMPDSPSVFFQNCSAHLESEVELPDAFMDMLLRQYIAFPHVRSMAPDDFISQFRSLLRDFSYTVVFPRVGKEALCTCGVPEEKLSSPEALEQTRLAILDYYYEALGRHGLCYPAVVRNYPVFILHFPFQLAPDAPSHGAEFQELDSFIRGEQERMRRELGFATQIICSTAMKELRELPRAFREVLFACDYLFDLYPGRLCITPAMVLEQNTQSMNLTTPPELERVYFESVIHHDFQMCNRIFHQLIREGTTSFFAVMALQNQTHSRMMWTLDLLGVPNNRSDTAAADIHKYPENVHFSKTLSDLFTLLDDFFRSLEVYYRKVPKRMEDKIDMVIRYIKENFQDTGLSVAAVAEAFNVSQEHLSRMFKKKTGIKIVDYIHVVRLTHAKQMMENSAHSLQEIAIGVGYTGEWTLSRAFKRFEHTTPGAYRAALSGRTGEEEKDAGK